MQAALMSAAGQSQALKFSGLLRGLSVGFIRPSAGSIAVPG
jgi:hypothetical protein